MNLSIDQLTFQLFYYTNFLILSILVPFVILLVVLLLCRKFKMKSKLSFVFAIFFQMDNRGAIYMVNQTIRYLLVISALAFNMHIDILFFFILVVLTFISALLYYDLKGFIFEIVNNFIIVFSLIFVEYLRTYMHQVRADGWQLWTCGFLICFLVLYTTYFYLRAILKYLKRKRLSLNERTLRYDEKA